MAQKPDSRPTPSGVVPHGDEVPLGRTGFMICREPTPSEQAFMDAVAHYAGLAIVSKGTYAVCHTVIDLIDQYGLGYIRERTLDAARAALPSEYHDQWTRLALEARPKPH